jgi:hypothetical protein
MKASSDGNDDAPNTMDYEDEDGEKIPLNPIEALELQLEETIANENGTEDAESSPISEEVLLFVDPVISDGSGGRANPSHGSDGRGCSTDSDTETSKILVDSSVASLSIGPLNRPPPLEVDAGNANSDSAPSLTAANEVHSYSHHLAK